MKKANMMRLMTILLLQSPLVWGQTSYTLKDLEALEKEKNFEEFLKHAMDIRPSERQKLWKEMYQSMALEMLDSKIRNRDYSLATFKEVEKLANTSTLINDEFFQLKRSIYAKNFFNECYLQSSATVKTSADYSFKNCDMALNSFWTNSKKDTDIGLELAELIDKYPSTLSSWPYYQRAISDSTVAPIYCEKPNVQKAVLKKLTQETFHPDFNGNYKLLADRVIPAKCFPKLVPTLKAMTASHLTNGLEKEMAMNVLEAKGQLSDSELEVLAVVYLLDGPVVGEKMNLAWNRVEKLGENFSKRQEILAKIKALPTIPDKIFKDPESSRYKAIINLFAKNFPEYLNYYGEQCVDFLDTKKEVPTNIASGFQCTQFLKTAQQKRDNGPEWISDAVSNRYSGLQRNSSKK